MHLPKKLGLGSWSVIRSPASDPYLGSCWHDRRLIEVREDLGDRAALETLAHEAAHALAGPAAGHGLDFERAVRRTAHALGVDWRRCLDYPPRTRA